MSDIVGKIREANATRESYLPWSDYELAADEIERLRAALDLVMVGGNHLANVLIKNLGGDFADRTPYGMDHQDALRIICATDNYDVWCCWAAIMKARASAAGDAS